MNNIPSNQLEQARNQIQQAQGVLVTTHANPTIDSIAASTALYLALSATGKQVRIACSSPMTVEFSHLVGMDRIINSINGNEQGNNLVISFPYEEGSIEKVSYNIEGNRFNLVIEPREGYASITPEMINYSFTGGNTNLIITVDTPKLVDLKDIYQNNQSFFQGKTLINIDSHNQNTRYGQINLVDPSTSSTSELIVSLSSSLGLNLTADVAANLLKGITQASNNFTSNKTSAATFEAAAICARSGTKKPISTSLPTTPKPQQFQPATPKARQAHFGKAQKIPIQKPQVISQSIPKVKSGNQQKKPPAPPPFQQPSIREGKHPETPPDWLKPKIYKGSTLL